LPHSIKRRLRLFPTSSERSSPNRSAVVQSRQSKTDQPIRVLIVTARFFPDLGGVETHVHEVTRRLAKRSDFDLTVVTTDRSGALPVKEIFEGFTVLRCRSYPRYRDYYFSPDLYRLILDGNYDVIHCQGVHTAVPVLAMIAAIRKRVPYTVTLHTGGHSSHLRHSLRNLQWQVLAPLLRRAEVVVAVSRFEQQIFQRICHIDSSRFRVIHNGGDLPVGSSREEPIHSRIVSSGRLERYKGHQHVIKALPIVQQSKPDATLKILGAGPYESKLRALIKTLDIENSVTIEYIPPDDRKRMTKALSDAAVFAMLSEYEAHPVAVMEALTLGIPVVGSETAGISDLIEDGLVRGVPKNASPATIAQALVTALGSRGTSGPRTLPTWDTAAAGIAQIYLDALGVGSIPVRSRDA
jgi:glycosyltransferase involved in cell wall biosynthesis